MFVSLKSNKLRNRRQNNLVNANILRKDDLLKKDNHYDFPIRLDRREEHFNPESQVYYKQSLQNNSSFFSINLKKKSTFDEDFASNKNIQSEYSFNR